jgi:hypothetical protein
LKKPKKNIIIGYKINDLIMGILTLIFSVFMLFKMESSESNKTWILMVLLAIGSILILWKFINPNNKFVKRNSEEAKQFEIEQLKNEFKNTKTLDFNRSGFKTIFKGKSSEVNWTDIRRVNLLKRDLFKKNEYCLDIWVDRGSANSFGICETSENWLKFTEKLLEQFPKINKEWKQSHSDIESNKLGKTIYERKNVR